MYVTQQHSSHYCVHCVQCHANAAAAVEVLSLGSLLHLHWAVSVWAIGAVAEISCDDTAHPNQTATIERPSKIEICVSIVHVPALRTMKTQVPWNAAQEVIIVPPYMPNDKQLPGVTASL
jgi:hypothetical protein